MTDIGAHAETTSQCIYCMKTKPVSDFNREHVISRFMGTYITNFVLNKNQVCEECNTYFSENMESVLSLDSYEALLRATKKTKGLKSQRPIGETRLHVVGHEGIIKGLEFDICSDINSQAGIRLDATPSIGFVLDEEANTYEYCTIDTIPECTDEIKERLRSSKSPIVLFGYDENEVASALKAKGYDLSKTEYRGDVSLPDIIKKDVVETQIKCTVDLLLKRLAAKNILNFICHAYGKEYALQPIFDNLRAFIRYGAVKEPLNMMLSKGGLINIPNLKENGHIIGTSWSLIGEMLHLCGFVTWFGAITYIFAICPISTARVNYLPLNIFAVCDNQDRIIDLQERTLYFDWPGNAMKIEVLDEYFHPIEDQQ